MAGCTNEKLERYRDFLKGKTVGVLGVGISNLPLLRFLVECGADVTARDQKSYEQLAANPEFAADELAASGVRFVTGEHYLSGLCEQVLYRSPGMRYDRFPEILAAIEDGAILTSEMEAFLSLCPATMIAVTGSDGKTTTTTLIAEMLRAAGKTVYLGGNIGKPLLPELAHMTGEDYAVLELSSFQLHTVGRFDFTPRGLPYAQYAFPDVAVVTNLSPNHLDWHTDFDEYRESKKAIYRHMRPGGRLVTNLANRDTLAFARDAAELAIGVSLFTADAPPSDAETGVPRDARLYTLEAGFLCEDHAPLFAQRDILIPGRHNVENYLAAIAAVRGKAGTECAAGVARTFRGVPNRLECVASCRGVRYYNSSIDSSPTRTLAALSCFGPKELRLILGGYDKHLSFAPLADSVCEHAAGVYLSGPTADAIATAVQSAGQYSKTGTPILRFGCFDDAVRAACRDARPGEAVLLSPACASFDAFRNFEERGKRFAAIVSEETAAGA